MTTGQGWNLSGRKMGRAISAPSFSAATAKNALMTGRGPLGYLQCTTRVAERQIELT